MLGGPALDYVVNFAQDGRGKSLPSKVSGGVSNGMGRGIRAIHSLALLTSFWRLVPGRLYFFVGLRCRECSKAPFWKEGEGCRSYWSPLG
jgi:hypothetical protein